MNTNKFSDDPEVEILEKDFDDKPFLDIIQPLTNSIEQYILFLTAVKYYKPYQSYHNFGHAKAVTQAVLDIYKAKEETPDFNVLLAAIWHDAIYIPGSRLSERLSGQALEGESICLMLEHDKPTNPLFLYLSIELISKTALMYQLNEYTNDNGLNILLDADLVAMANSDYNEFMLTQQFIQQEHANSFHDKLITDALRCNFKSFLKQFLAKEHIYRTSEARAMWEEQARKNLTTYCNS